MGCRVAECKLLCANGLRAGSRVAVCVVQVGSNRVEAWCKLVLMMVEAREVVCVQMRG